jgi:hypothetical protein
MAVARGLLISIKSLFKGPGRTGQGEFALYPGSSPRLNAKRRRRRIGLSCIGSTVLRRDYREKTEWLSNFC